MAGAVDGFPALVSIGIGLGDNHESRPMIASFQSYGTGIRTLN